MFKAFIRHPSRDIKCTFANANLEFRKEVWAESLILEVVEM